MSRIVVVPGESWLETYLRTRYGAQLPERLRGPHDEFEDVRVYSGPEFEFDEV